MLRRRVVVTGTGIIAPPCLSNCDFQNALLCPRNPPFFCNGGAPSPAELSAEHRGLAAIPPRELRRIPRFARLAIAAAAESLEFARVDWTPRLLLRAGVSAGSAAGGLDELEQQQLTASRRGVNRVSPFLIPQLIVNAASGNIAAVNRLQGPCLSWSAGCASGTVAIGEAFRLIQSGEADLMLAGGAEAAMTNAGLGSLQAAGLLPESHVVSGRSGRPFDPDSRWFMPAEGAGFLVLESLDSAQQRGAEILAEISGYSSVFDSSCEEDQVSSAHQLCRTMQLALQDAEADISQIDVVCAHAIGIEKNDLAEARAIAECCCGNSEGPLIMTGRSHFGHAMGATGAIDAVAGICMLKQQQVPSVGGFRIVNSVPTPIRAGNTPLPTSLQSLLLNSFSFGGQNASLVICRWQG